MSVYSDELICKALEAELISERGPRVAVAALVSDSRQMSVNSMFVCIRGEAFDGHQFAGPAVANGAVAILCEETPSAVPENIWVLVVKDVIRAFRAITGLWRRQFDIPIVAVVGSVGKTTTKQLITAALSEKFPSILHTKESQNGYLGIAITLAQLRSHHDIAVIEIGIDEPGAMEKHLELVQPSIAIVTAIAEEHMENFSGLNQVAEEEMKALQFTDSNRGTSVINQRDHWIRQHRPHNPDDAIFYCLLEGEPESRQLREATGTNTLLGCEKNGRLHLTLPGQLESEAIDLPLPGKHNADNLLAAVAVAYGMGVSLQQMIAGLKTFNAPSKRSVIEKNLAGMIVIGDHYNASPASMRAAFSLFEDAARIHQSNGRRYVCLGDMLELGDGEERYHRELASELMELSIDGVFLYGERMKWLESELEKQGFHGLLGHFSDHKSLSERLLADLQVGDTVLLKGSRGMRLERVWDKLLAFTGE